MQSDYRMVSNKYEFSNVILEKNGLLELITAEHPKTRNFYNSISNKKEGYFKNFAEIYNHKCAYCGVKAGELKELSDYEIDHIICESSYEDKCEAGRIDNLTFSCKFCNRKKRDFLINVKKLHPDTEIHKNYFRDDLFNIKINNNKNTDSDIVDFYKKLEFDNEIRRLDFLLMQMIELKNTLDEGIIRSKLQDSIDILRKKRNLIV